MVRFSGLKQGIFPDCPWHIRTHFFTPFLTKFPPLKAQKAAKKLKNCIFGQISNSPLIFLSSLYFGAEFQILLCPPIQSLSKLD